MRTSSVGTDWWLVGLQIVVALAILAAAWAPAWNAPYQYDDTITPLRDPASQSLQSWARALPRTLRPLTKLSYAAESSLDAISAPERRFFNGLLFVAATALLAMLIMRSGVGTGLSIALALLWAVHPVHAETVVALAGRSVLLSLTLCLASALCVLQGRGRTALALAFFAVSARETALPWLPVCAALALEPQLSRRALWSALAGVITLGALLILASERMRQLLMFSWSDPMAGNRLGLQWAALPRELMLWLFAPDAFTVDIEFAPRGFLRAMYLLGAVVLYTGFAWLALRAKRPLVRVASLLWLCLVIPLHSVVPKLDPLTARSVSAHSAALMVLVAVAIGEALRREARMRWLIWTAMVVLFALVLPITREHAAFYRDPVALWREAAERTRDNTRALVNLGTLLAQKGQLSEARANLLEAVRRDPHSSDARERLAAVEVMIETKSLLMEPAPAGNR